MPAFLEDIDKTHPASEFAGTPEEVAEIKEAEAVDQVPLESEVPTESEVAGFIEDVQAASDAGLLDGQAEEVINNQVDDAELASLQDEDPEGTTAPVYSNWKRDDLNARAAELGIEDAAELPNKDAVIAAIEEAEAK